MGIMNYIAQKKSEMRQKQYMKEQTTTKRENDELILARARRGMLEEQNRVRNDLQKENTAIKDLQPKSLGSKLSENVITGMRELNKSMYESRMRKGQVQGLGVGKKKKARGSQPMGSTSPFMQKDVFSKEAVFK